MDAAYALLQKKSVRDLTMEEIAKRARVGLPTLYKWWPTALTGIKTPRGMKTQGMSALHY